MGRNVAIRQWAEHQIRNAPSAELKQAVVDSARELEADFGGNIGEELFEMLRTEDWGSKERNENLGSLLAIALSAPLRESAEFFEGFALTMKKRAASSAVWTAATSREHIYSVLANSWPEIPQQRTAKLLIEFILTRMPARLERGIRREERLYRAFQQNVRKACNALGLSTGKVGRPAK